jgi:hypothetical protein
MAEEVGEGNPGPGHLSNTSIADRDVLEWLSELVSRTGCNAAVICRQRPGLPGLEPQWWVGYPETAVAAWLSHPTQLNPLARALTSVDRVAVLPKTEFLGAGNGALTVVALIGSDGRVFGVLGLAFPEIFSARRAVPVVRAAAKGVAEWLLGDPLSEVPGSERAVEPGCTHMYREVRGSRAQILEVAHRLKQLQSLTRGFAAATDPAEVAQIIVSTATRAVGANAATITAYDGVHPPQHLAATGISVDQSESDTGIPFGQLRLVKELVTQRKPVLVTSFADRNARYPDMKDVKVEQQAWANLPLVVENRCVGIIAFGWDDRRNFSSNDLGFLRSVSAHAAIALDRSILVSRARGTAEALQRALLPQTMNVKGWEVSASYIPAVEGTRVGGDWYDVFVVPGGRVGLVLGDVAGKGTAAAAVTGVVRSALRAFALIDPTPATVLTRMDAYFAEFETDQLVTLCYGVLDPVTGSFTYASAGHPPALVVGGTTPVWLNKATTPPLGAVESCHRIQATITISLAGDNAVLLLYSDGLIERRWQRIDDGLLNLSREAIRLPAAHDLAGGLEHLVRRLDHPDRNIDDVGALAIRRSVTVRAGHSKKTGRSKKNQHSEEEQSAALAMN